MWRFRALMYETVPQTEVEFYIPGNFIPASLRAKLALPICLNILRICAYWRSRLFTSCTLVPEPRDALSAAAIDDFMMNTLVHCHRVDDRFHTIELSFIYFVGVLLQAGERSDAGQHSHEALQ